MHATFDRTCKNYCIVQITAFGVPYQFRAKDYANRDLSTDFTTKSPHLPQKGDDWPCDDYIEERIHAADYGGNDQPF